jgi:hypothetical protein
VEVPVKETVIVEKIVEQPAAAVAAGQKWLLVNPEGAVVVQPVEIAPRIASLEGKTVLLRANGKHNSQMFLDRVAELLTEQVKGVNVIKMYEAIPGSASYPMKAEHFAAALELKPDIMIASQAD